MTRLDFLHLTLLCTQLIRFIDHIVRKDVELFFSGLLDTTVLWLGEGQNGCKTIRGGTIDLPKLFLPKTEKTKNNLYCVHTCEACFHVVPVSVGMGAEVHDGGDAGEGFPGVLANSARPRNVFIGHHVVVSVRNQTFIKRGDHICKDIQSKVTNKFHLMF